VLASATIFGSTQASQATPTEQFVVVERGRVFTRRVKTVSEQRDTRGGRSRMSRLFAPKLVDPVVSTVESESLLRCEQIPVWQVVQEVLRRSRPPLRARLCSTLVMHAPRVTFSICTRD